MNTIVVGAGEIGASLCNVLKKQYQVTLVDKNSLIKGQFDVMHVCFPFSETFIEDVKQYQVKFNPKFTVIHSTVPVGTSRACNAMHSPIIGIHPHLEESIRIFTKFIGGKDASYIADMFRKAGIKTYVTDKPESTELMKLLCTTSYALNIEFTKEVKRLCDKYNAPFELFTLWNNNYNEGYTKLEHPEYHRYNLLPLMKSQGGHCTISNAVNMHEGFEQDEPIRKFLEIVMAGGVETKENNPLNDKFWLYSEYWGKKKTLNEIGKDLDCTGENVGNFMKKHKIKTRDKHYTDAQINTIIQLHAKGMTFKEISKEMNKEYESIRNYVYKHMEVE